MELNDIFKSDTDESFEDRVLLAIAGNVSVFGTPEDHQGVAVRMSGHYSTWEPYESAARRLVKAGLFHPPKGAAIPINYYEFTERGRIAHWALREAFLK